MPVPTLLLPVGGILAALYFLAQKDKTPVGPQPTFSPTALDQFTEMRAVPGGMARFFKTPVAAGILGSLAGSALEPVTVQGGAPGLVFKIVPMQAGAITAAAAAQTANAAGAVVLASLSTVLVAEPGDKLLLFATSAQRAMVATPQSQFAILLDSGSSVITVPGAENQAPFDPSLPPDLARAVNAALADPNITPEALDAMAGELDKAGFPIAAKMLRDRASALRLKARVADAQLGTPFTIRATPEGFAADLPSFLSKHYTGDGNRWREIAPINKGMIIKNQNLDPWHAGQTVLLPLSWDVPNKPMPRPLGVPKKVSGEEDNGVGAIELDA